MVIKPGNDDESPQEYIGLVNQAMTCYLNSFLQTLYMTPEFRNHIFKWRYNPKHQPNKAKCIPYQLQVLFLRLQTSSKASVETRDITESFGWSSAHRFQQHDVQELTHVLFEALEECWKGTEQENTIKQLYEGVMVDYVKCIQCTTENVRETPFLDIPLVIRPFGGAKDNESVEEAISEFIKPELLNGNNKYACEKCDCKTDARKGLKLKRLPYLLTLHLKRFDYNYLTLNRIKLNTKVSFPFVLDAKQITGDFEDDTKYDLYSVMVHSGNALGGHYFSYIRSFVTKKWYEFNDQKVIELSEDEVCKSFGGAPSAMITSGTSSTNAYMLVYRKRAKDNQEFLQVADYPDHLLQALEDIKEMDLLREKGGGDEGEYETELFYKQCNSTAKVDFKFSAKNSLQETTEQAALALNIEYSSSDDMRLVLYDIEESHCRESFNVESCSPISVLIGRRRNMIFGLLLEKLHTPGYLELGQHFQKYIRGDFCCTIYEVIHEECGHSTLSVSPFVVRIGLRGTVGELKAHVKAIRCPTSTSEYQDPFLYRLPRRSRLQLMPDDASGLHMDEDFKRHNILVSSGVELTEIEKPDLLKEVLSLHVYLIIPEGLKSATSSGHKIFSRNYYMKVEPISISHIVAEADGVVGGGQLGGLKVFLEKGTPFSEFNTNLASYFNITSHQFKIMDELCDHRITGDNKKWTDKIMKIVILDKESEQKNSIEIELFSLDKPKRCVALLTQGDVPLNINISDLKKLILGEMRKSTSVDIDILPSNSSFLRLRRMQDDSPGHVFSDESALVDSDFLSSLQNRQNTSKLCVELLKTSDPITCATDRLVYIGKWVSDLSFHEIVIRDDSVISLFEKIAEISGINKNLLEVSKLLSFNDEIDEKDDWFNLKSLTDCTISIWPLCIVDDGEVLMFRNMENKIDKSLFVKRTVNDKERPKDKTSRFPEQSLKIRNETT